MNFVNKTLFIEAASGKSEEVTEEARKIVKKIEPDVGFVVLTEEDDLEEIQEEEENSKSEIIKIIIAAVLLGISVLTKDSYKTPSLIIGLIAYIIVGYKVLYVAVKNIFAGDVFSENFLMSVASLGAVAIGAVEEGIAVMLLYSLGEYLQDKAVDSSTKSIKSLVKMKPTYGNLVTGEETKKVNPKILEIDDIIRILPGEKIPVDSIVISGSSSLDTSSMTGESMPVYVDEGDELISGSINNNGVLEARVTKSFKDSTVNQILEMVQNASGRKSKTERFITVFSRYYTPVVVLLALVIAVIPPLVTGDPFYDWIYTALTFLVISCPCAMVISIPLTYFASIGAGSRKGILIKGSNYIDTMVGVDTVIFDKTGTLTKGQFQVTNIIVNDKDENYIIEIAKKLEEHSNHPIAQSIKEYHKEEVNIEVEDIAEVPGRGIKGMYNGEEALLGNMRLLDENNIKAQAINSNGTVLYLAVGGKYIGAIEINDIVKEDSVKSLEQLKKLGVKNLVMLTGDRYESAKHFAEELGITSFKSDLLPQDKVAEFEKIKENAVGNVAFVGDGTNDAPVLRLADIGISMGEFGSDAAIESSDVTIMGTEMKKVPLFMSISKRTKKIAIQNIVFALGVKTIVMILGVLGYASMWAAVFADVGVTLLAILNAMRVMVVKENLDK